MKGSIQNGLKAAPIGFAVGLSLLAGVLWVAHRNTHSLLEIAEWRQHSHEVTAEIRAVLGDAVDAETGARGYVITGDETFLEPYRKSQRDLPGHLSNLRLLLRDNPEQTDRLRKAETLLASRLQAVDGLVAGRRAGGPVVDPGDNVREGKRLTDGLRGVLGDMESAEALELRDRDLRVHAESRWVDATLVAGGAVGALLLTTAFIAFEREVRQRRQAEHEVRSQTTLLESVLDSMVDGVAVADTAGRFTVFNRSAEQILGAGPAANPEGWSEHFGAFELDGRTPYPSERLPLARAIGGETLRDAEVFLRNEQHRDGIVISINAMPRLDEQGAVVGGVAVFRDVTERRRAEVALRAAKDTAELASKELEAFSYSVSHDLRAPLRGIDGFSQALLEDYGDGLDAEGKVYLERIRAGAQRMGLLIDDLLRLARVTRAELRRESVDITALAREVAEEVRARTPGREGEIRVAEGLTSEGDPRLLRVAFENLISNAWKFSRRKAEARIEIGTQPCDGGSAFYVRDNGSGFDMAYADKLFGAFQRLHAVRDFEGTGIGLATVERVVRRHGGRIWAHAVVDEGATFYFTLAGASPLAAAGRS